MSFLEVFSATFGPGSEGFVMTKLTMLAIGTWLLMQLAGNVAGGRLVGWIKLAGYMAGFVMMLGTVTGAWTALVAAR